MCDWCTVMARAQQQHADDVELVANQHGSTVIDVLLDGDITMSFTRLTPYCLCGGHV